MPALDDESFQSEVSGRLAALPDVEAVTLGGSRATGSHRADSDWDLAVYYRGHFSPETLRAVGWRGRSPRSAAGEAGSSTVGRGSRSTDAASSSTTEISTTSSTTWRRHARADSGSSGCRSIRPASRPTSSAPNWRSTESGTAPSPVPGIRRPYAGRPRSAGGVTRASAWPTHEKHTQRVSTSPRPRVPSPSPPARPHTPCSPQRVSGLRTRRCWSIEPDYATSIASPPGWSRALGRSRQPSTMRRPSWRRRSQSSDKVRRGTRRDQPLSTIARRCTRAMVSSVSRICCRTASSTSVPRSSCQPLNGSPELTVPSRLVSRPSSFPTR